MRKCTKCKNTKSAEEFNFKDKTRGRRNARCKECTRRDVMNSYYKNQQHYLAYRARRNKELRKEAITFQYEYLCNHPCIDCGISDPVVLQFDHVLGKKKHDISNLVSQGYTIKVIISEIRKCEIRCANCHMKKTASERGYYSHIKQSIA